MEERKAKILINRAGGNAGAHSKGYRVALPSAWMKSLGITENDREVLLQFDGARATTCSASTTMTGIPCAPKSARTR